MSIYDPIRCNVKCKTCDFPFEPYENRKTKWTLETDFCKCQHRGRVPIDCLVCGREFVVMVSQARQGWKFCSRECYKIGRSKEQPYRRRSLEERFAEKFQKVTKINGACWLWVARKDNNGYGVVGSGGSGLAHRLSWEKHNGKSIPVGLDILHSCDNPSCVNPDHLRPGTQKDNAQDMTSRNRQCRGSRHPRARFTEEQVLDIRRRLASGESCCAVARSFGVWYTAIQAIKVRETWKHL